MDGSESNLYTRQPGRDGGVWDKRGEDVWVGVLEYTSWERVRESHGRTVPVSFLDHSSETSCRENYRWVTVVAVETQEIHPECVHTSTTEDETTPESHLV